MQEIRIFSGKNEIYVVGQVNDFIKKNNVKVLDIQYSTSGGSFIFGTEYSVMLVIEEEQ